MLADGALYWLGLGTLVAVLAIAFWQWTAARRAQAVHERSTVPPHEGHPTTSRDRRLP
jgi:hypothetical protein